MKSNIDQIRNSLSRSIYFGQTHSLGLFPSIIFSYALRSSPSCVIKSHGNWNLFYQIWFQSIYPSHFASFCSSYFVSVWGSPSEIVRGAAQRARYTRTNQTRRRLASQHIQCRVSVRANAVIIFHLSNVCTSLVRAVAFVASQAHVSIFFIY